MKMARTFLTMFPTVRRRHFLLLTVITTRYYGTIAARKGGVTDSEKAVRRHSETITRVKENAKIHVSGLDLKRVGLVFYQEVQEYVRG